MFPDLTFDPSRLEWKYIAEGNKNIVFGNERTSLVLRVMKEKTLSWNKDNDSLYENEVDEQWSFVSSVVVPLIADSDYFLQGRIVNVSSELLARLGNNLDQQRPKHRLGRGIDLTIQKAWVYVHLGMPIDKLTVYPTICVEIKPKWGFLCTSTNIKAENKIKRNVCRFCMHQRLKFVNGVVSMLSSYCPLDLFSMCTCRVSHALKSLFHTPHNNLRIFVNGSLAYDEEADTGYLQDVLARNFFQTVGALSPIDHLVEILAAVLLFDSGGGTLQTDSVNECRAALTPMCPTTTSWFETHKKNNQYCRSLQGNGVLAKLLSLQKMNGVDIEDAYPVYLLLEDTDDFRDLLQYDSALWQRVVKRLLAPKIQEDGESNGTLDVSAFVDTSLNLLARFLIASTFRDSSIMITLHRVDNGNDKNVIFDKATGVFYRFRITLADLDPKSARKIPKYLKRDAKIVKNYMKCQG